MNKAALVGGGIALGVVAVVTTIAIVASAKTKAAQAPGGSQNPTTAGTSLAQHTVTVGPQGIISGPVSPNTGDILSLVGMWPWSSDHPDGFAIYAVPGVVTQIDAYNYMFTQPGTVHVASTQFGDLYLAVAQSPATSQMGTTGGL